MSLEDIISYFQIRYPHSPGEKIMGGKTVVLGSIFHHRD